MKKHDYAISVEWTGNMGTGTSSYAAYSRNHIITGDRKGNVVSGSSDPAFRGDSARYNPEELLLAALSACHMLWALHLCADRKIVVLEYRDDALGVMAEEQDGSGKFINVTLQPRMRIATLSQIGGALEAHELAHRMCFIANSVNFQVVVQPNITS